MSHLPRYSPEHGDDPCPSDMETHPGSGGDGDGNAYWQNYTHEPDQQDYYDNQTDNYVPTGDPNDPAGSNDFPEVSTGDEHGHHFQPTQAAQDADHHQSTEWFVDEHGHHFQPTQAAQDADRRQSTESFVDDRRLSFDRREEYHTDPVRAALRRRAEVSDRTREPYRKCRPRDEQSRSNGSSGRGSSRKESSSKGSSSKESSSKESSSKSSSSKGSSDRDSRSKGSSGKGSSRKDH